MKNRFLIKLFALAVIVGFSITSCKDYDGDVNNLQKQLDGLKSDITAMQTAIKGGTVITGVKQDANGITITLSDGKSYTLTNGKDGAKGADGKTLFAEVGANGNWFVDGKDTGKPSQGAAGKDGKDGVYFVPNADGFWHKIEGTKDTKTDQKWLPQSQGTLTAVWENGKVTLHNVQGAPAGFPIVLGGTYLTSLVHFPELYVGGVEAIELRPLIFSFSETVKPGPTVDENGCPIAPVPGGGTLSTCIDNIGSQVSYGGVNYRLIVPSTQVSYHVSPSTLSLDMIEKDKLMVTSHTAEFRAGGVEDKGANPFSAAFNNLSTTGKLTVDMSVDPVAFFKYYGGLMFPKDTAVNPLGKPVLALQIPHSKSAMSLLPAGSDTYVTSDFVRTIIDPLINLDIAKKQEKNIYPQERLYPNYLGKAETGSSDLNGYPASDKPHAGDKYLDNVKALKDGVSLTPEDIRIVKVVAGTKVNLVDYVKGVSQYLRDREHFVGVNIEDYGFEWHFDLLDGKGKPIVYELTNLKTDQQSFIKLSDNKLGTITSYVYSQADAGAAVDRTPIVRVRIMKGDCAISEAFIKVLFVKKADTPEEGAAYGPYKADTPDGCNSASRTITVQEMNEDFYNKLGISKDEFVLAYGPLSTYKEGTQPANVTVKKMGRFEWLIDKGQNSDLRTTYLPKWTVDICGIIWCVGETEKTVNSVVTIKPIKQGYPDLTIDFTAKFKKPAIDLTKTGFNIEYWDKDFTYIRHHSNKPAVGENLPANNTYKTNINAAFKTHKNKSLYLGENYVKYEYVFAPAALQIKKSSADGKTSVKGDITVRISDNGKELYAKYSMNATDYTKDTEELIATITDHTATDTENTVGEDWLEYQKTPLAKFLLNVAPDFMWAKLQIKGNCGCYTNIVPDQPGTADDQGLKVTINGKPYFDVHFLRPININPISTEHYIDGVDLGKIGSVLDIYKVVGLHDWHGDKFKDNWYYPGFYGIQTITYAGGAKWDMNGEIEAVPTTVDIRQVEKTAVEGWDAENFKLPGKPVLIPGNIVKDVYTPDTDKEAYKYGGIVYWQNHVVVNNDFNLYIPVKIVYNWGTIVSDVVKVKVVKTNVAGNKP